MQFGRLQNLTDADADASSFAESLKGPAKHAQRGKRALQIAHHTRQRSSSGPVG